MIILDTNVVSEPTRAAPSQAVRSWIIGQRQDELFTTSITQAEMLVGMADMPAGRRRALIEAQIRLIFEKNFAGRVLAFDSRAAAEFELLPIRRSPKGEPIIDPDGQIAAIARAHGATLATRNIRDFRDCGIDLVDPWTA